MKQSKKRIFIGDFETTVWDNPLVQDQTEVWASGIAELFTDYVRIDNCIEDTYDYLLNELYYNDVLVYYHNLKFDGTFWIDFLMNKLKLEPAVKCSTQSVDRPRAAEAKLQTKCTKDENGKITYTMCSKKEMRNNTFICSISSMGQWYNIQLKMHGHILEFRDSLKLIPVSVENMGKSYKTKHQKLTMDYVSSSRHAHGVITPEERKYLENDLFVVKEVLEIMYKEGHDRLTIGSCCMHEFKKCYEPKAYDELFPDLTQIPCEFGEEIENPLTGEIRKQFRHMDDYIRTAYHGGWCYINKKFANKLLTQGITADVNSLYPSQMHSESGNYYPIGVPHPWEGNFIPKEAKEKHRFYYLRVRTRFYLKKGKLPTIQIKDNRLYKSTEWLETSDIYNKKDEKYYRQYIGTDGKEHEAIIELTLSQVDLKLFLEHYNVEDYEILDGVWFYAQKGIFDEYINKYREIKENSTAAVREIAKLYLNNLYGKMAASKNSSFKFPYIDENGIVKFKTQQAEEKQPGYIAIGAAITSYARNFTIRAAQANYKHFVYADTDSIHCCCTAGKLKGIIVDSKKFNCWKLEATWDEAIFVRQKTYIEHVYEENLKPIKRPYYNIKCAGMPKRCKNLFNAGLVTRRQKYNLSERYEELLGVLTREEKEFLEKQKYNLTDFTLGLCVPSKLYPRRVVGGIVLTPGNYQMR